MGQAIKEEKRRNRLTNIALEQLAYDRDYIRVMDVRILDTHLRKCPFRKTFWQGCQSDPDFFEQLRIQGANVLAIKNPEGLYLTHHLRREKVRVVQELEALPLSGLGTRNLTDGREDSTTYNRVSDENSVDS